MLDEENKDADLQPDEQDDQGIIVTDPDADTTVKEADKPSDQGNKEDPSDKLTPDHPRFKDVVAERNAEREEKERLQQELEDLKSKPIIREDSPGDEELTPEEQESLVKIKRELAKDGFVRQTDLQVTKNAENLRDLGKKYDGTNGLPKFQGAEIVAHAKRNGFGDNYEAAYRDMHFDTIVEQEAVKRNKVEKAPTTEKPAGGGEESGNKKRLTEADIEKMTPDEYDKYRVQILQAIKPKSS